MNIEIGDMVSCNYDLKYFTANSKEEKYVKSGSKLIVENIIKDRCFLNRYNKHFVVDIKDLSIVEKKKI